MSTSPKTDMAMENLAFEDAFSIENGDFPASHVRFKGVYLPQVHQPIF